MMTEGAVAWKANGWRTTKGEDVKNKLQVEEIAPKLRFLKVEFRKVAGHKGDD
jgi:ribonuclease HI